MTRGARAPLPTGYCTCGWPPRCSWPAARQRKSALMMSPAAGIWRVLGWSRGCLTTTDIAFLSGSSLGCKR